MCEIGISLSDFQMKASVQERKEGKQKRKSILISNLFYLGLVLSSATGYKFLASPQPCQEARKCALNTPNDQTGGHVNP